MVGLLEGSGHLLLLGGEVDQVVVGPIVVELGSIGRQGLIQVGHRGKGLELGVGCHEAGGVLRHVAVSRHHCRVRRAHITDPVHRQRGLADRLDVEDLVGEGRHIIKIGAGEHRMHTGKGEGRAGVDADDAGVGLRAPDEGDLEHAGQTEVGHVPPATGERRSVLAAEHRPPDVCGPMADHRVDARGTV